ncbi:MAG: Stp1/IreP family PP2C-type Ser/Thr phosphatase [Anaerostipes sp.]|jgi:serine/threonine protein phosphatase PrpC|nr:Stp1/IreP family PP2C-type Ser/Thr phosphatase [Anaerostipes sp.]
MQSVGNTHIGKVRTENQDAMFFSDQPVGRLENLYIIADGMGGHKAGGYASSYTVDRFVSLIREDQSLDPIDMFIRALRQIEVEIMEKCKEKTFENMGTTLVAATIFDGNLYIMNIGDSRLYYFHDGIMKQITVDHSYVQELVKAGEIDSVQMKHHPKKNLITRAVGAGIKDVEPDFFQLKKEEGYLLLCTDGLTNMVDDDEIEKIIEDHSQLENKASLLVNRANEYGGKDNITVVLVKIEERGENLC